MQSQSRGCAVIRPEAVGNPSCVDIQYNHVVARALLLWHTAAYCIYFYWSDALNGATGMKLKVIMWRCVSSAPVLEERDQGFNSQSAAASQGHLHIHQWARNQNLHHKDFHIKILFHFQLTIQRSKPRKDETWGPPAVHVEMRNL